MPPEALAAGVVYVGPPRRAPLPPGVAPGRRFANPYTRMGREGPAGLARAYARFLHDAPALKSAARSLLRGRHLACQCAEGAPCHAQVLLQAANAAPR